MHNIEVKFIAIKGVALEVLAKKNSRRISSSRQGEVVIHVAAGGGKELIVEDHALARGQAEIVPPNSTHQLPHVQAQLAVPGLRVGTDAVGQKAEILWESGP